MSSGGEMGIERKREMRACYCTLYVLDPLTECNFFFLPSNTMLTLIKCLLHLQKYNRGEVINTWCQALWGPRRSESLWRFHWSSHRCSIDNERWESTARFSLWSKICKKQSPAYLHSTSQFSKWNHGSYKGFWVRQTWNPVPVWLLISQ